jgi:hypothetical protein
MRMSQLSNPTLVLEPITRIGGKRYSGIPSTNSSVNTPTSGEASNDELLILGRSSAAQPTRPKRRAVDRATQMAPTSGRSES